MARGKKTDRRFDIVKTTQRDNEVDTVSCVAALYRDHRKRDGKADRKHTERRVIVVPVKPCYRFGQHLRVSGTYIELRQPRRLGHQHAKLRARQCIGEGDEPAVDFATGMRRTEAWARQSGLLP